MKIVEQSVALVHWTDGAEGLIEQFGRICWKSQGKQTPDSAPRMVKMLINKGHESVLEHAVASFLVVTDRAIANEIVRHRIGMSYSQESTRYVNYGNRKGVEFIMPPFVSKDARTEWESACSYAENTYLSLTWSGVKPEIARSVLPLCLATTIGITGNFRAWRHFLKLRLAKAAHPQIRELSGMILKELKNIAPSCFEDLG